MDLPKEHAGHYGNPQHGSAQGPNALTPDNAPQNVNAELMTGYLAIDIVNELESNRLASNECMVGSPLTLRATDTPNEFEVLSAGNNRIGALRPLHPVQVERLLMPTTALSCFLSLVYYVNDDKHFHAELYYVAHAAENDAALSATRVAHESLAAACQGFLENGIRPPAHMTAAQAAKIAALAGTENASYTAATYPLEERQPLPALERGEVIFKKKRTGSDKFVIALANSPKGAKIVVNLIAIAIMIFIIYRIARLFI